MRRTELCSLSLSDVAVDRGVIEIRFGKGGKPRKLGINPSLRHALKKYVECRPQTKCDRFFVTADGLPIRPEGLSRRIMRVARRAGLDVTTHSFRRTAATVMALNGTSLPVIQGVLGHTTETMANQYVKLTEHNIVESMQAFVGIGPREAVHEMRGRDAAPVGSQLRVPARTITARVVKKLS
ncbi:Tyrosine recombinase XerD [compost metagenome]